MSDIVKALDYFKDNYSSDDLVTFINSIPFLKKICVERAKNFEEYLNKSPELIKKFVKNTNIKHFEKDEERNLISNILRNRLHLFYWLNNHKEGETLLSLNDIELQIALNFYLDNNAKKDFIDYIKIFCVIPANYSEIMILPEFTESFKKFVSESGLTDKQREIAEIIYKSQYNISRKELAEKLHITESGVQSHIDEMVNKNIIDGLKDLRTKIKNTKN